MPSTAFATASATTSSLGVARRRGRAARSRRATRSSPARPRRRERERVAEQDVELRERERQQPLERPGVRSRSIVIEVTRNIETSGKSPSSGTPTCWNTSGRSAKSWSTRKIEHARDDEEQRDRARVAAELGEHAQRGRDGAARLTRAPPSTRRRNASSRSLAPVRASSPSGRLDGEDASLAEQDEPVAARCLVHDVARDEQRRAAVAPARGRSPTVAAQHRVEPDGRLVEHEQLRLVEERRRERDTRALATGERRATWSRSAPSPTRVDDRRRPGLAPTPTMRAK